MPASYFDGTKNICAQKWAVTLVQCRASQHAELVVEGIEDSTYLCQFAHFVGPMTSRAGLRHGSYLLWSKEGEVKPFKVIEPERLNIANSRTWLVNRAAAKKLIAHVNNQPKKRPFQITGDLGFNSVGELLFIGKEYLKASPDMVLGICVELLQVYLGYHSLQWCGFSEKFSLFSSISIVAIKDIFYKTALEGKWPIYSVLFADSNHLKPFVHTLQAVNFNEMDQRIDDISDLEMTNNCFTWAKKELEIAGIYVRSGWFPRTSDALSGS